MKDGVGLSHTDTPADPRQFQIPAGSEILAIDPIPEQLSKELPLAK
jgi:hypothetical protein